MFKINLILTFLLISLGMSAQFVNNGATVTIQSGATLRVETDIQNNGTGTITNNGTIEVSGNFTNAATATLTPGAGLVKFVTATGSPANATLDAGGDALNNVEMAKTSNHTVTLTSPASMSGNLSFTGAGSKILLGAHDLTMTNATGTVTATTNHPTNGYVVTNGAGKFVKALTGSATVAHQIGDVSNYTPVSNVVTASTAGTLGARVYTTGLQAKYTDATDYINREWNVVATGGVTAYTMTGTYVAGDAVGSASLIKGCTYHTGDWQFAGSGSGTNQVIASTTNTDVKLSGQNFFGKVNLKAFLQGPYSSGAMTTTLNINNLIPLTSPYADATASVLPGFFGSNPTIVDWVKLELRDPSAPSTSTTNKASAFIKSDGTIVGIDGTSLPRIKNGFPTSVVVVSHRNHLPIRTPNSGIDVTNPTLHNFSASMSNAYDDISDPTPPMANINGVFALFGGDVNGDGYVRYTDEFIPPATFIDSDALAVYSAVGYNSQGQLNTYNNADVNFDGFTRYTDEFIPPSTFIDSDALKVYAILGYVSTNQLFKNL